MKQKQLWISFVIFILLFSFSAYAVLSLGLIDIILLWLLISLTIIKAWPVRPLASLLLIPYLVWVMYATSLNAGIWLLNR
ncbi:MAG TPA: tryptophan-rich sensory protein [Waddliaceae bacterium]